MKVNDNTVYPAVSNKIVFVKHPIVGKVRAYKYTVARNNRLDTIAHEECSRTLDNINKLYFIMIMPDLVMLRVSISSYM